MGTHLPSSKGKVGDMSCIIQGTKMGTRPLCDQGDDAGNMSSITRGKKFGTHPHHQGDKGGNMPTSIRATGAVGRPEEVAHGGMSPMSLPDPSWT